MVSSVGVIVLFLLVSCSSGSVPQNAILPKAALISVAKDPLTLHYVAAVSLGQTRAPLKLVLDLNAPFAWVHCGAGSSSRSRKSVDSCSLKCAMGYGVKSCCSRGSDGQSKMCMLAAENAVSGVSASSEMNEDELALRFLHDLTSDSSAKIEQFLFSCAPDSLLKGLPASSKGVLGLGNSRISLPSQFSSAFGVFERKFSICLSPTRGAIFLGGNPFETQSSTIYTPLISNKENSFGYYINLQAIKISGKKLSFPERGSVSAKLSTLLPYTTMETQMYHTFVKAYVEAAVSSNFSLVSPIAPFDICFSSKAARDLPVIDLILQSEVVAWRIFHSNSLVHVNDEVMCLGFMDGGLNQNDPIVLGSLQLENRFLEFNLGSSMLGFSSTENSKCSDFDARREF